MNCHPLIDLSRAARPARFRAGRTGAIAFCLSLLAAAPIVASAETIQTKHHAIEVQEVADGLRHPWSLAFLPDGNLLVTERRGRLYRVDPKTGKKSRVDGIPRVAARGQGGLLDVVLDPDFASNNQVYLSYSEPGSGGEAGTAVMRAKFTDDGNNPRLTDQQTIFRQSPKSGGGRHFGSRIVFARDGNLFVTIGDRGQRPEAQNTKNHIGSVVRIAPDGSVPEDNPFLGNGDALDEIWSFGHRNPQGAALNPQTGELWTLSHGARGGDEVNISRAGKNYGWPEISYGTHYSGAKIGSGTEAPGMEQPIHYWDPSIAPSGLTFYTGDLFPEWRGNLFAGALKDQLISRLELDGDRVVGEEQLLEGRFGRVRDVRQGPDGALWFLTDRDNGGVYRIVPAS